MRSTTKQRAIRHRRVRKKVAGSPDRPRLAVFRSNKHIYAQVIDDLSGTTLASASTLDSDAKAESPADAAGKVGKLVAARAKEKGIESVVFDRGGFKFHGVVKAVAEGAREEGLRL